MTGSSMEEVAQESGSILPCAETKNFLVLHQTMMLKIGKLHQTYRSTLVG